MIYKPEDFIENLSKLHPQVTKKSLELIVKKGLQKMHKQLIDNFEVELWGNSIYHEGYDWMKIIQLMTPEEQYKHSMHKYRIKKQKQLKNKV